MINPTISRFCKTYLPGKGLLYFWGILFLVLTILSATTIPNLLKNGINVLEIASADLTAEQKNDLFWIAIQIISLGFLLALFRVLSRVIIFIPGRRIEAEIRQDYYNALSGLSEDDIRQHELGDLVSRGTNDVTSVRVMISMGILHSINSILLISICLYQMFQISGHLTVFCLIPAPFILVAVKKLSRIMMDKASKMQKELGNLSEVIREHLNAHTSMMIFPIFQKLYDRFQKANLLYSQRLQEHVKVRTILFLLSANFSQIASFILLYFGAQDAIKGDLSLGAFAAFSSYLGLMQDPLRSGGFLISIMQRGEVCLRRIYQMMDLAEKKALKEKAKPIQKQSQITQEPGECLIEAKELFFQFEDHNKKEDNFVLDIPSLEIKRGKRYGIFGPTGSGKSLLLRILSGNVPAPDASFYFEGKKYEDFHDDLLRKQFAIVTQENNHFAKTIQENIDQVKSNPVLQPTAGALTQYSFEAAYQTSCLAEDVSSFSDGLDTLLGEHGINLSGGQRQRLALLRALVKPHQVLILDDIVSSVDHQTEKEILRYLDQNLHEKDTVLISSHRISALLSCDEIWLMEKGKILEKGTHQQLLKKNENYRKTFQHQVIEDEIEDLE